MTDLKTELTDDPLARGYSGMTDQQAADDLNTVYRTRNRTSMTGDEVFQALESQSVWESRTPDQRIEFLSLCARDSIDPFASANVDVVISVFGAPAPGNTTENLQVNRVENITRAVELPNVRAPSTAQHVKQARAA